MTGDLNLIKHSLLVFLLLIHLLLVLMYFPIGLKQSLLDDTVYFLSLCYFFGLRGEKKGGGGGWGG